MKRVSTFLIVLTSIAVPMAAQTKGNAKDREAINNIILKWQDTWNRRDMKALAGLVAEDVDLITVGGAWLKSRKEFEEDHTTSHQTIFKESVLTMENTKVSFIKPDVAVAQAEWSIKGITEPDGTTRRPQRGISTWVVEKRKGKWLIIAAQNTIVREQAPSATLTAGQAGRIAFETITLNDSQFLKGEKADAKATIWGDLRFPQRLTGRVPAVILAHGTVGVGPREERWAEELNSLGVATFVLDSFSGRGLKPPFESGAVPSPLTIIIDSYRALRLIATHPRIDPNRIALMGFSRGGVATLYASLRRFQRLHGPSGLEFAAYIPFYANCTITWIDEEDVTDRPIRLHHGTADENLPIGACREYVKRLRQAGKDIQLAEYYSFRRYANNAARSSAAIKPRSMTSPLDEIIGGKLSGGLNRATRRKNA